MSAGSVRPIFSCIWLLPVSWETAALRLAASTAVGHPVAFLDLQVRLRDGGHAALPRGGGGGGGPSVPRFHGREAHADGPLHPRVRAPSALPVAPAYEGCARSYLGAVEDANIIKLYRRESKVSYLSYPDFDRDPHLGLHRSVNVCLQSFKVRARHYDDNRPILHRKELFVAPSYPRRTTFARLTAQEERHGLYFDPAAIGHTQEWKSLVTGVGLSYRGHRLVRIRTAQSW